MEAKDADRFRKGMAMLAVTNDKELTDALVDAYWLVLRDLDVSEVLNAMAELLRTSRFMPKPAEIVELCCGNAETRALSAWDDVVRAQPLGAYKSVNFADASINAVIRSLGGWVAMFDHCATSDGEHWYRQRFLKAYAAMNGTASDDACRPLAGISQAEVVDGKVVHAVPRIVKCGDDSRKRIATNKKPATALVEFQKP